MKPLRVAKPRLENFVVALEPGIHIISHLLHLRQAEGRHMDFIRYDRFGTLRGVGDIRIEGEVKATMGR